MTTLSVHPVTVTDPAGKYGRPQLRLTELWSRKGAGRTATQRCGQLDRAVTVICETPAVASMSKPFTPGAHPGTPGTAAAAGAVGWRQWIDGMKRPADRSVYLRVDTSRPAAECAADILGRVLIVGHGGIIRAAIPALCPGTPVPATDLPNCGIAELALYPADAGAGGILRHWPLAL